MKAAKLSTEQLKEMGARIRVLREAKLLGQREVGKELGYEESTGYWRVEKGETEIALAKLVRLAELLDTSLDFIVRGIAPLGMERELNVEQRAALYREMRTPQEHREQFERHIVDAPHLRITPTYARGYLNRAAQGEQAAAGSAVNVTALNDLVARGGKMIDTDDPPVPPPDGQQSRKRRRR